MLREKIKLIQWWITHDPNFTDNKEWKLSCQSIRWSYCWEKSGGGASAENWKSGISWKHFF